jgi:tRNA-dihydrouridine synthase
MMDWTDRHCRYFLRLLSPGAMLYTEMVTHYSNSTRRNTRSHCRSAAAIPC